MVLDYYQVIYNILMLLVITLNYLSVISAVLSVQIRILTF